MLLCTSNTTWQSLSGRANPNPLHGQGLCAITDVQSPHQWTLYVPSDWPHSLVATKWVNIYSAHKNICHRVYAQYMLIILFIIKIRWTGTLSSSHRNSHCVSWEWYKYQCWLVVCKWNYVLTWGKDLGLSQSGMSLRTKQNNHSQKEEAPSVIGWGF